MTHIDVKAYSMGEMGEADTRSAAAHVAGCEACREELAGVQATLGSLALLRDEELPRRIAFISDKVFEPKWWQRIFNPTFASACVVAAAIVFHGFTNRGPGEAEVQARIDQAVSSAVSSTMDDRVQVMDQMYKQMLQQVKVTSQLVSY